KNKADAERGLAKTPTTMVRRTHFEKGEESVPIFGPVGLLQQIGSVEYSCSRRFRGKPEQWLRTIRLIWPECPARISADGRYIVVNHAISVHPAKCSTV